MYNKHDQIIMTKEGQTKQRVLLKSMGVGAATALMSLPFQHPFDALKTNMQSDQTKMLPTIKNMAARKGWRSFYDGFIVNSIRVAIKQAYRWPLWISISSFYKKLLPNAYEVPRQTITGFSISFCELIIICPFERIKIWLMTTKTQDQTKIRKYYHSRFSIRDLYIGFTSLLIRQGLSWTSFLGSSQVFKNLFKKYRGTDYLSSMDLFYTSIPVAIINTLFIMPIDCIKTFYQRYQGFQQKISFPQVVRKMVKKYGLKGLYLGWSARIIQYNIQSAFTLILIEDLHNKYMQSPKKI